PPYVVFSDTTLRELARARPSTPERMRSVYGVGDTRLRDFGPRFLELIREYAGAHGILLDLALIPTPRPAPAPPPLEKEKSRSTAAGLAFALFREGTAVEDVMHRLDRARTTVLD